MVTRANPSALVKLLLGKGAGIKCWVIFWENAELDGKEIDLQTALKETVGRQMGTFISCIPGKLAYFEDEDGRYILERRVLTPDYSRSQKRLNTGTHISGYCCVTLTSPIPPFPLNRPVSAGAKMVLADCDEELVGHASCASPSHSSRA